MRLYIFIWPYAKPKVDNFGLMQCLVFGICCNSVRIPQQLWLELTSTILLAYMFSLLPAQGGWAGGQTIHVETPTFPSTDSLSWSGWHHLQLFFHKALMIVSGFQVPHLRAILQELWEQDMLDDQTIRHSCPILLKQPNSPGTAGDLRQRWNWVTSVTVQEAACSEVRGKSSPAASTLAPETEKSNPRPLQKIFWAQWSHFRPYLSMQQLEQAAQSRSKAMHFALLAG